MKFNKIFAGLIAAAVSIMILSSISVSAEAYKWYDLTDTEIKANTPIEINSIDEGLRQAINDTVQNYEGCTVTFKVKYNAFNATDIFSDNVNRAVLVGIDYYKAYADINGNYITFNWDEFIPKHNMWGMISNIKFAAGQDITITDVYIYVPTQDKPKLADLSAGACAYETVRILC